MSAVSDDYGKTSKWCTDLLAGLLPVRRRYAMHVLFDELLMYVQLAVDAYMYVQVLVKSAAAIAYMDVV